MDKAVLNSASVFGIIKDLVRRTNGLSAGLKFNSSRLHSGLIDDIERRDIDGPVLDCQRRFLLWIHRIGPADRPSRSTAADRQDTVRLYLFMGGRLPTHDRGARLSRTRRPKGVLGVDRGQIARATSWWTDIITLTRRVLDFSARRLPSRQASSP